MSLYKDINHLFPYLISLRKLKNYISFDMSFPNGWKFPKKYVPESGAVEFDTPNANERGISFVSEFSNETIDNTLVNIKSIISYNIEREEKERLLEEKVNELKSFFDKNNISSLRNLKFDINNPSKLELVDESEVTTGLRERVVKE